ncbi:MAG: murein biosynthesis integral membrane protein MurJ [Tardiphaga sp.]
MIRSILMVSTGTLASRLLGFARDAMVATLLGAGAVADAFLVAFQLINVIRRLLTEGALNAALIPAWSRIHATQGSDAAAAFAGRVLATISAAVLVAALLIGLAMPMVIAAVAPGFVGQPTLQIATDNARLMLPYLAFAGPVTVLMGLYNAQQRFALTAFSPLLFNAALLGVMALLLMFPQSAATAAMVMAATVGLAGFLQLAMLMLRQPGGRHAAPLRLAFDRQMRGFLHNALPGMVASSGPQLLIVGAAVVASSMPSAVSWLYFANRLIELPLGIVGTAMGSVLIPELTRAARDDDHALMMHAQSRGLELAIGLTLPATLGLMVLSQPIVRLLFEHGAFTAADTLATAQAMIWLALGLPAHVLIKTLSPAFFARENTRTPLIATLVGLIVAIVAAYGLGAQYGASGIAAAIALAAWSNALLLIIQGGVSFGWAIDAEARRRLPVIVLAALTMGAALWALTRSMPSADHRLAQAAWLALQILCGLAIYIVPLMLSGALRWRDIRSALKTPAG